MSQTTIRWIRHAVADRSSTSRALLVGVVVLPAFTLVPYLWTPLPRAFHAHREIAGYFQSLAYWRDPIGQFSYLTPAENLSALHFHSFLSAPLVGLGFHGGGRFVALAMGVSSAAIVAGIAGRVFDDGRAALVAPGLLWAHPLFAYLAGSFMPETTSIALTAGSVLALLAFYRSGRDRRYDVVAAVSLVLAVTTHLWEAVVVLPLAVVALHHGDRRRALVYPTIAVGTALGVSAIRTLQPSDGSRLVHYAVWNAPDVLLSTDRFWLRFYGLDPLPVAMVLTLPLALLACAGAVAAYARERTLGTALLASWLVAGLAIPFLLANGYQHHQYYLWGLLAPLALVGTAVVLRITDGLRSRVGAGTSTATWVLPVALIALSASSIGVYQLGVAHGSGLDVVGDERGEITRTHEGLSHERIVELGQAVRRADTESPSQVVFVGDWGEEYSRHYGQFHAMGGVLIYSDMLVRTRGPDGANGEDLFPGVGPRFYRESKPPRCEVALVKDGGSVSVERCDRASRLAVPSP